MPYCKINQKKSCLLKSILLGLFKLKRNNNMALSMWKLERELKDLCVKCTTLKESTAKKYAKSLFDKFSSEEGCISQNSDSEYYRQMIIKNNLVKALNVLKRGQIESDRFVVKLKDITYVEFIKDEIKVTTKDGKLFLYGEGFEYLEYVFKYNERYY